MDRNEALALKRGDRVRPIRGKWTATASGKVINDPLVEMEDDDGNVILLLRASQLERVEGNCQSEFDSSDDEDGAE